MSATAIDANDVRVYLAFVEFRHYGNVEVYEPRFRDATGKEGTQLVIEPGNVLRVADPDEEVDE